MVGNYGNSRFLLLTSIYDFIDDILLEILLIVCNVLIFNIYRVSEMEKETKWKQQNQETPK